MGRRESGRIRVVLAISQREKRMDYITVKVLLACSESRSLMAVLGLCPKQWTAVAMRAQVVMAVSVRKELWPFWSVILMAVRDERTFYLMVMVLCDARRDCVLNGKTQTRAPLQVLFQTER
jgi:hypothetical protein